MAKRAVPVKSPVTMSSIAEGQPMAIDRETLRISSLRDRSACLQEQLYHRVDLN
jgi:hypothetical protein